MITFGAKYLSTVNIGEIKDKKEIVPYRAAISEFTPGDIKDTVSLNFLANLSLKKTGLAHSIFNDYLCTQNGTLYNKNWVRYLALTKEQNSYNYIKTRNILGLAEISSVPLHSSEIHLDYLQTIKNLFIKKYCFVGTGLLNFIKETYPDKNIVLMALTTAVKFYKSNGFVVSDKLKKDGLVKMKYFHK